MNKDFSIKSLILFVYIRLSCMAVDLVVICFNFGIGLFIVCSFCFNRTVVNFCSYTIINVSKERMHLQFFFQFLLFFVR